MKVFVCLTILLSAFSVDAYSKCSGNPLRYNGKLCASTTLYHAVKRGACGCGDLKGDSQFEWTDAGFVLAANQRYFDSNLIGWCGEKCGQCIRLTTTGGWVDGHGGPSPVGQSQVFMVTDLCLDLAFCAQTDRDQYNNYGYEVHFDLGNGQNQMGAMGWNNPEVTFDVVDCDKAHQENQRTPSFSQWGQCQCAYQGKRSVNETATYLL